MLKPRAFQILIRCRKSTVCHCARREFLRIKRITRTNMGNLTADQHISFWLLCELSIQTALRGSY